MKTHPPDDSLEGSKPDPTIIIIVVVDNWLINQLRRNNFLNITMNNNSPFVFRLAKLVYYEKK